jgi:thiamine-monophosphate kinase
VVAGMALVGVANAAIDISDGLAADLNHILQQSKVGASVRLENLPVAECFSAAYSQVNGWDLPLSGGDDYELLFTVPPEKTALIDSIAQQSQCKMTLIGEIETEPGLRCYHQNKAWPIQHLGYEHFNADE